MFGVLPDEELNQLASYVMHLSIRGETEFNTLAEVKSLQTSGVDADLDEIIPAKYQDIVQLWMDSAAEDAINTPPSVKDSATAELKKLGDLGKTPPKDKAALMNDLTGVFNARPFSDQDITELVQTLNADLRKGEAAVKVTSDDINEITTKSKLASVERGYNMFIGTACASAISTLAARITGNGTIGAPSSARPISPWGFTAAAGGRSISSGASASGIPGANMAGNADVLAKFPDGKDNPWRLWDMVNFIQALPYRKMLPPDIAEKIYPQHQHHD